jgi:hypothetical protein
MLEGDTYGLRLGPQQVPLAVTYTLQRVLFKLAKPLCLDLALSLSRNYTDMSIATCSVVCWGPRVTLTYGGRLSLTPRCPTAARRGMAQNNNGTLALFNAELLGLPNIFFLYVSPILICDIRGTCNGQMLVSETCLLKSSHVTCRCCAEVLNGQVFKAGSPFKAPHWVGFSCSALVDINDPHGALPE